MHGQYRQRVGVEVAKNHASLLVKFAKFMHAQYVVLRLPKAIGDIVIVRFQA